MNKNKKREIKISEYELSFYHDLFSNAHKNYNSNPLSVFLADEVKECIKGLENICFSSDLNDNSENQKSDYNNRIDSIVEVIKIGLDRLRKICIDSKVKFYSMPFAIYQISCDDFYYKFDRLIEDFSFRYPLEIEEEADLIKEGKDYSKISLVYALNESYVELINRVFICLNNASVGNSNNRFGFYITEVFKLNREEDYKKIAKNLLDLEIDQEILEKTLDENLDESKKNISKRIIILPFNYLIFPNKRIPLQKYL
jgi:hypothetical protein